ncbi:WbqC family protein [Streptomyces sp. IBSNAI002]|uniref:WbqC family protein n=1 Tax=Streptomyces sp. IBSNAI002 TaxID=3457500 RepID=UPI003FD4AA5A
MIYIEQPGFAPWLGFCEALLGCTTVALYDDVQYTEGGFQNRNRVKTPQGAAWLTVPVVRDTGQLIRDTRLSDAFDPDSLLRRVRLTYARAPYVEEALNVLRPALGADHRWLLDLNVDLITQIATALGSRTRLRLTSDMDTTTDSDKSLRLAQITIQANEQVMWAGSGTRGYLDTDSLAGHGISVVWNEFADRHPQYAQTWPRQGFIPGMSFIDAVSATGWAGLAAMLRTGLDAYLPTASTGASA